MFNSLELCRGNVYQNGAITKALHINFNTRQVFAQGEQAGPGGDVEFGQRARCHRAGGGNAMIGLKSFDGRFHFGVKCLGLFDVQGLERKIILRYQPLTQRGHIGALGALAEFFAVDLRPAAACGDFFIHDDGVLQRFGRTWCQHGRFAAIGDHFGACGKLAGGGGAGAHRGDGIRHISLLCQGRACV